MNKLFYNEKLAMALALAVAIALAWLYVVHHAAHMGAANSVVPPNHEAVWSLTNVVFVSGMWLSMMVAMMLPAAVPVLMIFSAMTRRRGASSLTLTTIAFVAGYFLVWGAFSVAAAGSQLALHSAGLLNVKLQLMSSFIGGSLFVASGIYQATPIKEVCLRQCQSPFAFLLAGWREGIVGALHMGVQHGLFCLGCCWALMLLLFAVGVMDVFWSVAIAALVLVEKLIPNRTITLAASAGLIGYGGWMMLRTTS